MMKRASRIAAVFMIGGSLAGCSSMGLDEMFTEDKQSLDESQIVANPTLAVPPDLNLRPPADGSVAPSQAVAAQPVTTEPPAYGAPEPAPVQSTWQEPAQPAPAQPATAPQVATAPQTDPNDPYAKWGVSKFHPDGRKKTQSELNEEMRQVKLKQKQAENPNYGTIWNMGNVWSDN